MSPLFIRDKDKSSGEYNILTYYYRSPTNWCLKIDPGATYTDIENTPLKVLEWFSCLSLVFRNKVFIDFLTKKGNGISVLEFQLVVKETGYMFWEK